MEKAVFQVEGFHRPESSLSEVVNLLHVLRVTHILSASIQHPKRSYCHHLAGEENDVSLTVGDAVEGLNMPRNEFLRNERAVDGDAIQNVVELILIVYFVSAGSPHSIVGLDDDWKAYKPHKRLHMLFRIDQRISCRFHLGTLVALLHERFVFHGFQLVGFPSRSDVEISA